MINYNNMLQILKGVQKFEAMKMSIIEKLKQNELKVKSTDLTCTQTFVVNYILSGSNWRLSKSEIAKRTNTSRVTVDNCYKIIDAIYEEILEDEKNN